MREMGRELPEGVRAGNEGDFERYEQVLNQKRNDKNKVYSLHEPQVYCIGKGRTTRRTNTAPRHRL